MKVCFKEVKAVLRKSAFFIWGNKWRDTQKKLVLLINIYYLCKNEKISLNESDKYHSSGKYVR